MFEYTCRDRRVVLEEEGRFSKKRSRIDEAHSTLSIIKNQTLISNFNCTQNQKSVYKDGERGGSA